MFSAGSGHSEERTERDLVSKRSLKGYNLLKNISCHCMYLYECHLHFVFAHQIEKLCLDELNAACSVEKIHFHNH